MIIRKTCCRILLLIFTNGFICTTQGQQWTIHNENTGAIPPGALGISTKLVIDKDNNVWATHAVQGVLKYTRSTGIWTHYNATNSLLPPNSSISDLLADEQYLWATHLTGLFRYNGAVWETISAGEGGSHLIKDNNGNLWLSKQIGINPFLVYDGTSFIDKSATIPKPPPFGPTILTEMAIDSEGRIWLAQITGLNPESGILFINGETTTYDQDDCAIFDHVVFEIEITPNDDVWIGTGTVNTTPGGVARLQKSTGQWTIYNTGNSPLPHNDIRDIKSDEKNQLWIGTLNGLARFDGTHWKIFNTQNSPLPGDTVTAIAIDSLGTKWIATPKGIVQYNEIGASFTANVTCGLNVLFSDESQSETNITSRHWDFAGLGSSSQESPSFTFPGPAEYDVSLLLMDDEGNRNMITQVISVAEPQLELDIGPDIDTCASSIQLSSNVIADDYSWETPEGIIKDRHAITANVSGRYVLHVNTGGCIYKDSVNVIVNRIKAGTYSITTGTISVEDDGDALTNVPLIFTSTTAGVKNLTWDFGDGNTASGDNVHHTYHAQGDYTITLLGQDSSDCPIIKEKTLHVYDLVITNAISPNGDGKNDKLFVEPFLYSATLTVNNRWGQEVYKTTSYNDDFTGAGLEAGVYYYELRFKEIDKRFKGYLHIID